MEGERARPGGRSTRVRQSVLEATLDELADHGYAGLSHEKVAARAGVTKKTVYRWWPNRQELLLDAIHIGTPEDTEVADTGSLEGDLVWFGLSFRAFNTPRAAAITRAFDAAAGDPQLDLARAALWARRVQIVREMVERAQSRGDVGDIDAELLAASLFGTANFLGTVIGRPFDEKAVRDIVKQALHGIGPNEVAPDSR